MRQFYLQSANKRETVGMKRPFYKGKDYKNSNPFKLKAQKERELEYLLSRELITPCRLLLVLAGAILMILFISLSINREEFRYENSRDKSLVNLSHIPYVFDHTCMLKKREEAMDRYEYSPKMWKVEKRSNLSVDEFWDLYDAKWPVIVTDIVPAWNAYKKWSKEGFLKKYGDNRILLKVVQGELKEGVAYVREMREFFEYLDQPSYPTAWTYMEDELFLIQHPELKEDLKPNHLVEENFFNLFPQEIQPWDCMMLWGSKYSRSTLHMDPYNWTALSAVIWGRKHWKLYPPGQDRYLYVKPHLDCGFPLNCKKYNSLVDAFSADYWKYPKFGKAEYLEVEQNSGELMIIPTGWFHQALNEEETLSISTQLMNRNNFEVILEEIIKGKNLSRKKLPPHFSTLLPPDQVKLFMSLIPKKILKHGQEVTADVLRTLKMLNDQTHMCEYQNVCS